VHCGATSQDVIDTALMLQILDCHENIHQNILILIENLIQLTQKYRHTPMIGRTLLQHAKPITFGFKTAVWLDSILRAKERLTDLEKRCFVLQLGGAVGSLSGMKGEGLAVQQALAKRLNLNVPPINWHTQRDRFVEIASAYAMLVGSLGKIAKDVMLLMQTEIAEVFEGATEGKGGSSAMPHKRNPVTTTAILAAANRTPNLVATLLAAMPQEQERSAGLWHSEWETMREILHLTTFSLEQALDLTENLEVNSEKMLANINLTQGLIFAENVTTALIPTLGKEEAHHLLETFCKQAIKEKRHLKDILIEKNILPIANLDYIFEPMNSMGLIDVFIDKVSI
jgi:3-carboxy-cis,cis-muconate cycloisomerase